MGHEIVVRLDGVSLLVIVSIILVYVIKVSLCREGVCVLSVVLSCLRCISMPSGPGLGSESMVQR
jgi:hypothetical protein